MKSTNAGMTRPPRLLGVIGGMGPLATVDFMQRLIELAPAISDQEHVPAMVAQIPQVVDRVGAVLRGTQSPLPQLLASLRRLERAGAEIIVMPCNTAHHWHAELAAATGLPFLHIADAVLDELAAQGLEADAPVGLLATRATLAAGVYASRPGLRFAPPDDADFEQLVLPAIALVKQGRVRDAGLLLERCVRRMRAEGVRQIVLGCTELPPALRAVGVPLDEGFVDSTSALARAAIGASLCLNEPAPATPLSSTTLSAHGDSA